MTIVSPFGVPVAPAVPNGHSPTAQASGTGTGTASGWLIQERPGSGTFVVSEAGTLLFRIDPARCLILAWDKKVGREIPIPVAMLPMAAI